MWVLSQDGRHLIEAKTLSAVENTIIAHVLEYTYQVGKYNTEKIANEVLKDIAACIGKGVQIFKMP